MATNHAASPAAYASDAHVLGLLNPMIQREASSFGATYVDIATPFAGREDQSENLNLGDAHPNAAGYAAIASALEAAVPAPPSVLLVGLGLIGTMTAIRRGMARKSLAR